MKTPLTPNPGSYHVSLNVQARVAALVALVTLFVIPLFSSSSASSWKQASGPSQSSDQRSETANLIGSWAGWDRANRRSASTVSAFLPLAIPHSSPETIDTYAADCSTPKSTFILGETVCAKTTFVTETNRFVNWCVSCPTIVYGGAGITDITTNLPQDFLYTPTVAGLWKATIADPSDSSIIPAVFTVTGPISTYAANCTTPKSIFNLGDTVCAKATGFDPAFNRRFAWVDPAGSVRTFTPITTDPQTDSFTLPATDTSLIGVFIIDNRGTWKVNVVTSRGSTLASQPFTVKGATPTVDLSLGKSIEGGTVDSGADFYYDIALTNFGPNAAANVVLTDPTPANATFVSIVQTSGPTSPAFSCTGTNPVVCTRATLAAGDTAVFRLKFTAGAAGATVANIASVTSDTTELNPVDNTASSGRITIGGGDGTPPTCSLECPNDITVARNMAGGATVTFPSPDKFGDCGTVSTNHSSGSFFPIGTTIVTATPATGGGSCTFAVTVIDAPNPTITCPPDRVVAALAGAVDAPVATGTPTVGPTDAGLMLTVTGIRDDEQSTTEPFPVGETIVTWSVKDQFDRMATCFQKITVTSPDAPTISCPSDKTFTTADCSFTASATDIGTPTTTGIGTLTVTSRRSDNLDLTDPYPAGLTVITWTATDSVGRVASCTQDITVHSTGDTTPPTLTVPPDVSATTTSCSETLDDELGVATASDNCSTVSITRTGVPLVGCPIPGNPTRMCESFVFPTGTTTITYKATDGSGNFTTGVQHVTVTENTPPTISAPADATYQCASEVPAASPSQATAHDNCGDAGVTVTVSETNNGGAGSPASSLIIKRKFTATDPSGNMASATQTITVIDNTAPVITLNQADQNPQYVECHTSYPELGATANDNCSGSFAATPSGTVDVNTPNTYTITYNATDAAGNPATPVTRTVIVQDTIPPIITLNGQTPSMWPPNHKYQTFQVTNFVTSVSDSCATGLGVGDVVIDHVTSDEIENGNGDGNTLNDIVIAADCKSVQLRAEREGNSNGRVYTITFKVSDGYNTTTVTAKVVVPHNTGQTPVDSGVHYTINSNCH